MILVRILVACEFSGIVRDAFNAGGYHQAWSCDLLPSETEGPHIQDDVRNRLTWTHWDLMIAFPPCTHLSASGARWWHEKRTAQQEAIEFVRMLWEAPIDRIAIENPIGILSTGLCQPTQIIQPWEFGHPETKATCLWLRGLPPLQPTHTDGPSLFWKEAPDEREPRVWREPPGPDRWKRRSRTYQGVANAMAAQWLR